MNIEQIKEWLKSQINMLDKVRPEMPAGTNRTLVVGAAGAYEVLLEEIEKAPPSKSTTGEDPIMSVEQTRAWLQAKIEDLNEVAPVVCDTKVLMALSDICVDYERTLEALEKRYPTGAPPPEETPASNPCPPPLPPNK